MILSSFLRIISNPIERWMFAGVVIIAANSGGAWSPIGDVTTIMLWMRGNITTAPLVSYLILPCLVSVIVPLIMVSLKLRKDPEKEFQSQQLKLKLPQGVDEKFSRDIISRSQMVVLS